MLELSPTLFLPILCVTPRPDRGVQGHMARPEQVALDSAIKSRNDECKEGAPPPPAHPPVKPEGCGWWR